MLMHLDLPNSKVWCLKEWKDLGIQSPDCHEIPSICETLDSFVIQLRFLQSIALSGEAHTMGSIHYWDINIHESMFQSWVGIKNCIKPPNWSLGQFLRFIDHKLVGFSKKQFK
jgi:hypothetical protein